MTKIRESLAEAAGTTCIMGGSTECPCPYPATEPIRHWGAEAPMLCAYHAATEPLAEEADALAVGLDLFEDWEAAARQHGDNEPLLESCWDVHVGSSLHAWSVPTKFWMISGRPSTTS